MWLPPETAYGLQANYDLGAERGLGLDVSLFERLVSQQSMPVHQLLVQRRMRPEISNFIRSTIYKDLVDGDNVKDYPNVAGELYVPAPQCFHHTCVHVAAISSYHQLRQSCASFLSCLSCTAWATGKCCCLSCNLCNADCLELMRLVLKNHALHHPDAWGNPVVA